MSQDTPDRNFDDGQDTTDPNTVPVGTPAPNESRGGIIRYNGMIMGSSGLASGSELIHYNGTCGGSSFDPPGGGCGGRGINHVIF
jgi:hypothetical protein